MKPLHFYILESQIAPGITLRRAHMPCTTKSNLSGWVLSFLLVEEKGKPMTSKLQWMRVLDRKKVMTRRVLPRKMPSKFNLSALFPTVFFSFPLFASEKTNKNDGRTKEKYEKKNRAFKLYRLQKSTTKYQIE